MKQFVYNHIALKGFFMRTRRIGLFALLMSIVAWKLFSPLGEVVYATASSQCIVDTKGYQACLADGMSEKFCTHKFGDPACLAQQPQALATQESPYVSQLIEQGYDPMWIEVELKERDKRVLQDFDHTTQDVTTYADKLTRVADAAETNILGVTFRNTTSRVNSYFADAAETYQLDHVENISAYWKKYSSAVNANVYQIRITDPADIEAITKDLEALDDVKHVRVLPQYDTFVVPNDPTFSSKLRHLQGGAGVNAVEARDQLQGKTITPVVCSASDSEFTKSHEDLAANIDYADAGQDGPTHGTHVAGIMLGVTDNAKGISAVSYNACRGKLYVGLGTWPSNLQKAHQAGAEVFNMSLGIPNKDCVTPYATYKTKYFSANEQAIIDAATAAGVTVIAAAGNDGCSFSSYPALYENVISVVALDQGGNKASFSNYGQGTDVAAPGVNIYSTRPGGYKDASGTSMATPLVVSLVGLLKALNTGLNTTDVEKILKETAGANFKVDACKAVAKVLGNGYQCTGSGKGGGGNTIGGSATAGSTSAGSTSAGSTSAGSTSAGSTSAGSTSAGSTSAGSTSAGNTSAGSTSAGSTNGGGCPSGGCPGTTNGGSNGGISCSNGVRDTNETDVDCGGTYCPLCQEGQRCNVGRDCDTSYCDIGNGGNNGGTNGTTNGGTNGTTNGGTNGTTNGGTNGTIPPSKDLDFTYANGATKKFHEIYNGHPYTFVDFSASRCGYCVQGAKTHNALFKSWSEAGSCAFAAVVADGDLGPWQGTIPGATFVRENSVYSKGDSLASVIGKLGGSAGGIPYYALYDESGKIVAEQHGYSSSMPQFEAICGQQNPGQGNNSGSQQVDFATIQLQGAQGAAVPMSSLINNTYVLVDFSTTSCGGCMETAKNHDALLKEWQEKGNCSFLALLTPGSLPGRLAHPNIAQAPFVYTRSMKPVNKTIDEVATLFGKLPNSGLPYFMLMDSNGKVQATYEGLLDTSVFAPYCAPGKGGSNQGNNLSPDAKNLKLSFNNGTTKTLDEVHQNQYLLLDIGDSNCGQCVVGAEKHNDIFQKRSNEGNCQLLTVTKDGDLPAWIGKIGAAPFVQKWSAYVVGGLYKLMGALNIQGTTLPYYALIDGKGQKIIDQIGWVDLEKNFATYCNAQGGGTTNGGANTDGACGPAQGQSFTEAGAVNAAGLCTKGVAVPATVSGTGPRKRQCLGTLGGTQVSCSAELQKIQYPVVDLANVKVVGVAGGEQRFTDLYQNNYLLLNLSSAICGSCKTAAIANDKTLEDRHNNGQCAYAALVSSDTDSGFPKWIADPQINKAPFIKSRSFYPSNYNIYQVMEKLGLPANTAFPYYFLLDGQGNVIMSKQGTAGGLDMFKALCAPAAGGNLPVCGIAKGKEFATAADLNKAVADLCEVGTPDITTFSGPGDWRWKCKEGTAAVDCVAKQKGGGELVDGVCGVANGKSYTTAGAVNAAGLCLAGIADPATVNGNAPWKWSCKSTNGGKDATCSTSSCTTYGKACMISSSDRGVYDENCACTCDGEYPQFDYNDDGILDLTDKAYIQDVILGKIKGGFPVGKNGDINNNGSVTVADSVALMKLITCMGGVSQFENYYCDVDGDTYIGKSPISTDSNKIPHITKTLDGKDQYGYFDGKNSKYLACDEQNPGNDCNDADINTTAPGKPCTMPNKQQGVMNDSCVCKVPTFGTVKGRSGSPDGKSINYPGGLGYDASIDHSCTKDGGPYCDGVKGICYPNGGVCYYYCEDSQGTQNYTTSCAKGAATSIVQPKTCTTLMQDENAGCGTHKSAGLKGEGNDPQVGVAFLEGLYAMGPVARAPIFQTASITNAEIETLVQQVLRGKIIPLEPEFVPGAYFVKVAYTSESPDRVQAYLQPFDSKKTKPEVYTKQLTTALQTMEVDARQFAHRQVKDSITTLLEDTPLVSIAPLFDATKVQSDDGAQDPLYNTYAFNFDTSDERYSVASVTDYLNTLKGDGEDSYVEKQPLYRVLQTNDPMINQQWYISKTEAPAAWTAGAVGKKSILLAVVDDGFDVDHPEIKANLVKQYNAMNGSTNADNNCLHGTHTATTAAGGTNNSIGIASISNNVGLMVVTTSTSCSTLPAAFQGMQYAAQNGANVVSMSFGGGGFSQTWQNLISSNPQVKFVAAAGNTPSTTKNYPAAYQGVLSVCASTESDTMASFSTYGDWVSVCAPGTNIIAGEPNNSYGPLQGTSMATPNVAALVALLLSNGDGDPFQTIVNSADKVINKPPYLRINVCRAIDQGTSLTCAATGKGGGGSWGGGTNGGNTNGGNNGGGSTNGGNGGGSNNGGGNSNGGGSVGGGNNGGGFGYGVCAIYGSNSVNSLTTPLTNPLTPTPSSPIPQCSYVCADSASVIGQLVPCTTLATTSTECNGNACMGLCSQTTMKCTDTAQCPKGEFCDTIAIATSNLVQLQSCTQAGGGATNGNTPTAGGTTNGGPTYPSPTAGGTTSGGPTYPSPTAGGTTAGGTTNGPINPTAGGTTAGNGTVGVPTAGGTTAGGTTAGGGGSMCSYRCADGQMFGTMCAQPEMKSTTCGGFPCFGMCSNGLQKCLANADCVNVGGVCEKIKFDPTQPNTPPVPCGTSGTGGGTTAGGTNGGTTAGGTSAGGTTAGGTNGGNNGSGTTGMVYTYPLIDVTKQAHTSVITPNQKVKWQLEVTFRSPAPHYSMGSLLVMDAMPQGLQFLKGEEKVQFAGKYEGVQYDTGKQYVNFMLKIDATTKPYKEDAKYKRYKATITYYTQVAATASTGTYVNGALVGCYAMNSSIDKSKYTGIPTCAFEAEPGKSIVGLKTTFALTLGGSGATCTPKGQEVDNCNDKADNDCDGKIDCKDSECSTFSACQNNGSGHGSADDCGDGIKDVGQGEECDDGNTKAGDGCSLTCKVEKGRQCTTDSPSVCGSLDCSTHGESFGKGNLNGQCCSGLEPLLFALPSKIIGVTEQVTLCYDPTIDEPMCYQNKKPMGRYLKPKASLEPKIVYETDCSVAYNDYYTKLQDTLAQKQSYCQFTDEEYERVDFKDITKSRERAAILALRHFCVVKGRGNSLSNYAPEGRVSRAEFIKMLYKTYAIQKDIIITSETEPFVGDTYFKDVSQNHWAAQYIANAHELGWLTPLEKGVIFASFFSPNKSITTKEVKQIFDWVEDGQDIPQEMIDEILGVETYPTRAAVANLLTKKFLPKFVDYFYLQDGNQGYYKELLNQLKGKKYTEQYDIIVQQIEKLGSKDHGAALQEGLDPFRIMSFLKKLASGRAGVKGPVTPAPEGSTL